MSAKARERAFTLIEVLIVVVIVAILSGTVISRYASSTYDAKEASLRTNLRILRPQILLYQHDHNGQFPVIQNADLPQLTGVTNAAGQIGAGGPDYPFGPYIDAIPPNSYDGSNKVSPVANPGVAPVGPVGIRKGWQYDATNGLTFPNHATYQP